MTVVFSDPVVPLVLKWGLAPEGSVLADQVYVSAPEEPLASVLKFVVVPVTGLALAAAGFATARAVFNETLLKMPSLKVPAGFEET